MNREVAHKLYGENWCAEDLDLQQVLQHIEKVAESGGHTACFCFDSSGSRNWIHRELLERNFTVDAYNNSPDIIEVDWG